jgi:hypothetical protein
MVLREVSCADLYQPYFWLFFIFKRNALLLLMELIKICQIEKFYTSSLQSMFSSVLLLSGLHDFFLFNFSILRTKKLVSFSFLESLIEATYIRITCWLYI